SATDVRPADFQEPEYCEKLDALNIPVITERVMRVCDDESRIRCLQFESGMELDADKVFFAIAQYPADDLGVQLGCERDDEGHIAIDAHGHRAARDVTPGPQLAVVAAATGATAALAMHKSLVPAERKLLPLGATTAL